MLFCSKVITNISTFGSSFIVLLLVCHRQCKSLPTRSCGFVVGGIVSVARHGEVSSEGAGGQPQAGKDRGRAFRV